MADKKNNKKDEQDKNPPLNETSVITNGYFVEATTHGPHMGFKFIHLGAEEINFLLQPSFNRHASAPLSTDDEIELQRLEDDIIAAEKNYNETYRILMADVLNSKKDAAWHESKRVQNAARKALRTFLTNMLTKPVNEDLCVFGSDKGTIGLNIPTAHAAALPYAAKQGYIVKLQYAPPAADGTCCGMPRMRLVSPHSVLNSPMRPAKDQTRKLKL